MLIRSFIVIALGCGALTSQGQYLSDGDRMYKSIEQIQQFLRRYNPVFVRITDSVFTKKNAAALTAEISESLVELFSFQKGMTKNEKKDLVLNFFNKYIPGDYPTRYQDPMSYLLFAHLIGDIIESAKKITRKDVLPKYGTIFYNALNAEQIDIDGSYLILFNTRLLTFSHQMGKVALQPIDITVSPSGINGEAFQMTNQHIDDGVKNQPLIGYNLFYTIVEFFFADLPANEKLALKSKHYEKTLSCWNNSFESFMATHEYAHQLLAHRKKDMHDAVANNLQSWLNEVQADSLSQLIWNDVVLRHKSDTGNISYNKFLLMGGQFMLIALDIYEKGTSLFNSRQYVNVYTAQQEQIMLQILSGEMSYEEKLKQFKLLPDSLQNQNHPPSLIRAKLLNQYVEPLVTGNLFSDTLLNQVEDLHLALGNQMIYGLKKMYGQMLPDFLELYGNKAGLREYSDIK
jgi:hypothetical protein